MNEIKMETESFKRAMAKAIENKPMVRVGKKTGQYFVAASDGFSSYPVVFSVGGGGRRRSSYLCAGGQKGLFCYHQAAALLVHSAYVRCGWRLPAAPRLQWSGSDAMRAYV